MGNLWAAVFPTFQEERTQDLLLFLIHFYEQPIDPRRDRTHRTSSMAFNLFLNFSCYNQSKHFYKLQPVKLIYLESVVIVALYWRSQERWLVTIQQVLGPLIRPRLIKWTVLLLRGGGI